MNCASTTCNCSLNILYKLFAFSEGCFAFSEGICCWWRLLLYPLLHVPVSLSPSFVVDLCYTAWADVLSHVCHLSVSICHATPHPLIDALFRSFKSLILFSLFFRLWTSISIFGLPLSLFCFFLFAHRWYQSCYCLGTGTLFQEII